MKPFFHPNNWMSYLLFKVCLDALIAQVGKVVSVFFPSWGKSSGAERKAFWSSKKIATCFEEDGVVSRLTKMRESTEVQLYSSQGYQIKLLLGCVGKHRCTERQNPKPQVWRHPCCSSASGPQMTMQTTLLAYDEALAGSSCYERSKDSVYWAMSFHPFVNVGTRSPSIFS